MPVPALVPVILSGGAGTRLWPLSREAAPKPFVVLPDGGTLLGKTAARARRLAGVGPLLTVTNRDYYFATKDVYATAGGEPTPEVLPARAVRPQHRRGRGAGRALDARACRRGRADGDSSCRSPDPRRSRLRPRGHGCACAAQARASSSRSASRPRVRTPASAISNARVAVRCTRDDDPPHVQRIARFVEKPPLALAQDYVRSGRHLWNSGMFCFTPARDPRRVRSAMRRRSWTR